MPDASHSLHAIPSDPAAAPFLRLIYAAWTDGELTDEEIRSVQTHIASAKGLAEATRTDLLSWLQPNRPPSIETLQTLLKPMNGDLASLTEPRPKAAPPISTASK
jgi:hypothetical protein